MEESVSPIQASRTAVLDLRKRYTEVDFSIINAASSQTENPGNESTAAISNDSQE